MSLATNAVRLSCRSAYLLLAQLLTTRFLLVALGGTKFGIYMYALGFIALSSIVGNAYVATSQRYLALALGNSSSLKERRKLFTANLVVLLIALAGSLVLLDTVGVSIFSSSNVIPENLERQAINYFFLSQFSIISTTLLAPYLGALVAAEKLKIYSFITIIDPTFRLIIAFMLMKASPSSL